jgi:hypothetical protein
MQIIVAELLVWQVALRSQKLFFLILRLKYYISNCITNKSFSGRREIHFS